MSQINPLDILAYLSANPNASLDALASVFPAASMWDLRHARRDFLRSSSLKAMSTESYEDVAEIPTLSKAAMNALRAGFFNEVRFTLPPARKAIRPLLKSTPAYRVLLLPDIHAPVQDNPALDVAMQIGQAVGANRVILPGDAFDAHCVAKYEPAAERPLRWIEERNQALPVIAQIRSEFRDLPIDFLFGNHDVRPKKYIDRVAPALQGLWTLPEMLGITDLGFNFPDKNRVVFSDQNLMVKHGNKVRGNAGASVLEEVREHGMSVIMGHVHRQAYVPATKTAQQIEGKQPLVGIELGCLCDLNPDYKDDENTANWQHGAALITIHENGRWTPELIHIFDGTADFRGIQFESRVGR